MKTDAIPYRNGDGEVEGVLVVSEDITEQKSREGKLERQNERLDQFTSVVSHDLRNPLNVAMGRVELARQECDSDHLAAVETAHARMETLVENLLQLARDGKPVAEPEAVDLSGLVDTCWGGVETADAELRNEASRWIEGDQDRLQQVFENLFRNSVEHGSTGSRTESDDSVEHGSTGSRTESDDAGEHGDDAVTITVGEFDHGIYVADDGAGIPADEREAVFEAGYSGSAGGTGFGLSIVAEIVEAHGWDIRVTDGADGGARFEITGVEFVGSGDR
jgi:signal transduction histidine kinase